METNTDPSPSRPPPLLVVDNFLAGSGTTTRTVNEDLADRLEGRGWRVTRTSRRQNRLLRLADMLATTWRRRQDYEVALVGVYSGAAFFWAEAVTTLLKRLGKPVVLVLHGGNLPVFCRRWPRRAWRLWTLADQVVAPSPFLPARISLPPGKGRLIPNPLDLSAYPFRLRERVAPRLVWLRAYHDLYQPEVALATLAVLAKSVPDLRLAMAGPEKTPGAAAALRSLAARLGVAGRIDWGGKQPKADVPAWLNRGDILLNTSKVDNTPVTLLEAMALGLCVVSTDAGGIPFLVKDGEDGLLAPVGDTVALAERVRRLLDHPELAARLSAAGRRKAEGCDWSTVLPQYEDVLQTTAAPPPPTLRE
ncbi:MAG: glycosyltransferase family 4 protein [Lentisphaeria bacterium]